MLTDVLITEADILLGLTDKLCCQYLWILFHLEMMNYLLVYNTISLITDCVKYINNSSHQYIYGVKPNISFAKLKRTMQHYYIYGVSKFSSILQEQNIILLIILNFTLDMKPILYLDTEYLAAQCHIEQITILYQVLSAPYLACASLNRTIFFRKHLCFMLRVIFCFFIVSKSQLKLFKA